MTDADDFMEDLEEIVREMQYPSLNPGDDLTWRNVHEHMDEEGNFDE